MTARSGLQAAARAFVLPRVEGRPGDVDGLYAAALEYAVAVLDELGDVAGPPRVALEALAANYRAAQRASEKWGRK